MRSFSAFRLGRGPAGGFAAIAAAEDLDQVEQLGDVAEDLDQEHGDDHAGEDLVELLDLASSARRF